MSTIRADNVGPSVGGTTRSLVRGVAAAWANINGTGTVAVRDSINMSSITDLGPGQYVFNYANSMANGNYSISAIASSQPQPKVKVATIGDNLSSPTTSNSGTMISPAGYTNTTEDTMIYCYQCFGSLA